MLAAITEKIPNICITFGIDALSNSNIKEIESLVSTKKLWGFGSGIDSC